jgi:threonine/homoserine/homoserine lactone efflux protein
VHWGLKWLGAAYLLYLGWQLLRAAGPGAASAGNPVTFAEAVTFQFVNPKAWVISVTAATLFLPPQLGQVPASGYVTSIVTLVNLPCSTVWAVFGSSLGLALRRPVARRIFNWLMAAALGATGVMMVA